MYLDILDITELLTTAMKAQLYENSVKRASVRNKPYQ